MAPYPGDSSCVDGGRCRNAFADTIIGNTSANALIGRWWVDCSSAAAATICSRPETARSFLDYDSYTSDDERAYTSRSDAVQARLENDYTAFGYKFTQVRSQRPTASRRSSSIRLRSSSTASLTGGPRMKWTGVISASAAAYPSMSADLLGYDTRPGRADGR